MTCDRMMMSDESQRVGADVGNLRYSPSSSERAEGNCKILLLVYMMTLIFAYEGHVYGHQTSYILL
jgi:hypothetical protein